MPGESKGWPQNIREYLKERHSRKKDKEFGWNQEKYKGEQEIEKMKLENEEKKIAILEKKLNILKDVGYPEIQIREIGMEYLFKPLGLLDEHIEAGRMSTMEFYSLEDL